MYVARKGVVETVAVASATIAAAAPYSIMIPLIEMIITTVIVV
jgi:hypothetical protein